LKSTSYIAKFSQSSVSGWKELIKSNRATEMHKFALILKEKQDWAKNLQHIPINSMPESKSGKFKHTDIIDLYISCYEVLKLDFDENVLILLHEYAEYKYRKLCDSNGLTRDGIELARKKPGITIDPVTGSLLKDNQFTIEIDLEFIMELLREDTILERSRIISSLEFRTTLQISKAWSRRDEVYKFGIAKDGYSHIGAMICYCMHPRKETIRNLYPLVGMIEDYIGRVFRRFEGRIHQSNSEKWLMKNMQDYLFRDLLADLISKGILGTYSARSRPPVPIKKFLRVYGKENPAPEYDNTSVLHSRLLMYDFLILTSKTCPQNLRIGVGHSDRYQPNYEGSIDSLTEAIYYSAGKYVNKRQFFRIYINDLDSLLDKVSAERSWKNMKQKDKKIDENHFRNIRPSVFINLKMFETWEWLLFMMDRYRTGSVYCLWSKYEDGLNERTTLQERKESLHDYLRLNWNIDDDIFRIGSKIYESQYEQLKEFASKKRSRPALQFMYENILDFTEISENDVNAPKGKLGIKWATAQRYIYAQYQKKINPHWHRNYIDWEICYILSRQERKNRDKMYSSMVDSFDEQLSEILEIMNQGILELLQAGTTNSTLVEILNAGSGDSNGLEMVISIVRSILNSHVKFNDIFDLPVKDYNRGKRVYFGKEASKSPIHIRTRGLLAEKFLEFLMTELSSKINLAGLSLNKTDNLDSKNKTIFGSVKDSKVTISAHRMLYSIEETTDGQEA